MSLALPAGAPLPLGPVLVLGFGPFGEVHDNPSARLAEAVDGSRVLGRTVRGLVLPVSYARAPALALGWAEALGAALVVATGVATQRGRVEVERLARPPGADAPLDVDGRPPAVGAGSARASPLDVAGLARVLDGGVSEDAGRYVCNALYHALLSAPGAPPAVFVHLPKAGLAPGALLGALAWLLGSAA